MENAFDVVRFSQVLEHLPEPKVAVEHAFRLLKPEGELILLLPNFASLLSRVFRESWFHLDLPRHMSHFTPDSIRRFLQGSGFESVLVVRYTAEHSITGTLRYWLEGKHGPPAFLHSLLTGPVIRAALIPLVVGAGMAGTGDLMEVRARKPARGDATGEPDFRRVQDHRALV
jgi:SAM-dependent methyltransferase